MDFVAIQELIYILAGCGRNLLRNLLRREIFGSFLGCICLISVAHLIGKSHKVGISLVSLVNGGVLLDDHVIKDLGDHVVVLQRRHLTLSKDTTIHRLVQPLGNGSRIGLSHAVIYKSRLDVALVLLGEGCPCLVQ